MIPLEDFKARCLRDTAEIIVDEVLLKDDAIHVSAENRAFIVNSLAST